MIEIIAIAALLSFFACILGQVIFQTSDSLRLLQPILGLSVICVVLSSAFLLGIPLILTFSLLVLASVFFLKRISIKRMMLQSALLLVTFLLALLPYLYIKGNTIDISGFIISNDTVVHAVMSRDCSQNQLIYKKFYVDEPACFSYFPAGTYGPVNLVSDISSIDTSFLVIPLAIFFMSFSVFIIAYVLEKLVVNNKKKYVLFIAPFITATYFYLAIAYHGFLQQSAYVPFVLAFAFLLFDSKTVKFTKRQIVLLSLPLAAALAVYGFVALLATSFIIIAYVVMNYKQIAVVARSIALVGCVSILLLGANNYSLFFTVKDLAGIFVGSSAIQQQSEGLGNLITNIDLRVATGLWLEKDYRLIANTGYKMIAQSFSIVILLVAGIQAFILIKKKHDVGKILLILIVLYILVYLIIGSPYSLIKIQSLVFLFVPVLFVVFILNNLLRSIAFTGIGLYAVAIMTSNYVLVKNLSYLDSSVLYNLKALPALIGEQKTLFVTDNDWALYYVDADNVDITSLHYRPDTFDRSKTTYDLIIKDGDSNFTEKCLQNGEIGSYYFCML